MKSTILIFNLLVIAALAACSLVGQPVAEKVADVVGDYCTKEPYGARQVYRQSINAELAGGGHSIAVYCNGDPADEDE